MEILAVIGMIIGAYILCKKDEWKSCNRLPPKGYETDWLKASEDIRKHGKQYYYQQHLQGKYDKKIEKK